MIMRWLNATAPPHLIPVYDSHVKAALDRPRNDQAWWSDLRYRLTEDAGLVTELEAVRSRARADAARLSLLRVFDIMCWIHGTKSQPGRPEPWAPGPVT